MLAANEVLACKEDRNERIWDLLCLVSPDVADGPFASAHWPDQAPHQIAHLGEFKLEGGGVIKNLKMSYVTHGKLNAAKDNAILFLHGFGANHHQFDHLIGPGRPLDTDKYFIICPDALGATQTTFEHSTSPTNSGLKMKFPFYNGRDMVKAAVPADDRNAGHSASARRDRHLVGGATTACSSR